MGAWIETFSLAFAFLRMGSHPTWVRGLKHDKPHKTFANQTSHPTWVRGLKRDVRLKAEELNVAPYVGAWIETGKLGSATGSGMSRTLRGCVD